MNISAERLREQISLILTAWGMPEDLVAITAEVMVDTDLAGIDSHGISMLMTYEAGWTGGKMVLDARPRIVRENAATALIDAGHGLGHPAAVMGMRTAMDKARACGVGTVTVRNSNHFGATGYYAALAAREGLIGMVTSSARSISVQPTRARVPMLGTNPIAFAAPAGRNEDFVLDMATSTVAANKVKVYDLNDKPLPVGWVSDENGEPITDAALAMDYVFKRDVGGLTPLGGTPEMGNHKGYGLGLMAHILGATMTGDAFQPVWAKRRGPRDPDRIGHFFLALDPAMFRTEGAFEDELDETIDALHATPSVAPDTPVLVAGEPEARSRAQRAVDGVPMPRSLLTKIQAICERHSVAYVLE